MNKFATFCLALTLFTTPVFAKKNGGSSHHFSSGSHRVTNVHGYTKKNGTYIAPHHRTSPNGTQRDNWTSKPNRNPYTGKNGSKEPQK